MYEEDRPRNQSIGDRLFAIGDIIRERYRVERLLSRDDDTDIYAVADLETQRPLALKTVSRERLGSDVPISRFVRELELSRRISHPGVECAEEVFEWRIGDFDAPIPCLLMERLEGENLASRLARDGRLSPAEALPIACQLAEALAASHRAGVVHRNLKPESVMLVPQSDGQLRVVLIDFGTARGTPDAASSGSVEDLTATNVILGTPYYMAPELLELDDARPAAATPTSDVYSLGLILFEMVTGRAAFIGSNRINSIFMRLEVDPPSPALEQPELFAEPWRQAILRCLARHPASRFAAADDVAAALNGESVPQPEVADVVPASQPSSSGDGRGSAVPWWVAVLGIVTLMLLIATWFRF